jgi:hypothetical protein
LELRLRPRVEHTVTPPAVDFSRFSWAKDLAASEEVGPLASTSLRSPGCPHPCTSRRPCGLLQPL